MVTYPIFINFSEKIFSAMSISALQYSFLHYESCIFFYWWFLASFTSTEKLNQKSETPKWNSYINFFTQGNVL